MPERARAIDHVGTRIRRLREDRDLTRDQLSARSGIPLRTLARVELEGRMPRVATLQAIARTLNVTVADLLGEDVAA